MLNSTQSRAAAIVARLRPVTMNTVSRAAFAAKVRAAAARAQVHHKYMPQFESACGLVADAIAAL